MSVHVDWLSFTIPSNTAGLEHSEETDAHLQVLLSRSGCDPLLLLIGGKNCSPRKGRGHYGSGYYYEAYHISIWFGGIANHVLVECAGLGCQALREIGALDMLIANVQGRITRLDIAVDIPTLAKPIDFVNGGYNARFKSRTSIISETGETEYVGSPSSERFARVYRYAPPHPRSDVLRVEFVLRGSNAKNGANTLVSNRLRFLAAQLGNTFGFLSPLWSDQAMEVGKLVVRRDERGDANSLFWLERQVKPALKRMGKDGLLDLRVWFDNLLAEME